MRGWQKVRACANLNVGFEMLLQAALAGRLRRGEDRRDVCRGEAEREEDAVPARAVNEASLDSYSLGPRVGIRFFVVPIAFAAAVAVCSPWFV
jgi:hypothetical protein